jgi:hypothetical protein
VEDVPKETSKLVPEQSMKQLCVAPGPEVGHDHVLLFRVGSSVDTSFKT